METLYEAVPEVSEARVQEHFDNNVDLYVDKNLECYEKASVQRLATLAAGMDFGTLSSFRLLDVGCGGGYFLDLFLKYFPIAEAWGIDFSSAMLQANTPSPRKTTRQGDALAVPEECGDFEVINIDTVLHHLVARQGYQHTLDKIQQCLEHLQTRLMPGGVICIREIYHEYFGWKPFGSRTIFFLSTLSLPKWMERILKSAGIKTANAGVCFLTRERWRQMFQDAGLSVLSVEDNPWSSQPFRWLGFKASGDIHYILAPGRPQVNQ